MISLLKNRGIPYVVFGLTSLAVYFPSLSFYFLVRSDDQAYIYRNPYLQNISLANIAEIFSNFHFDAYLPITLVSFSLDYTFWGFDPFGYHLSQLVLHFANGCLAFVVLQLLKIPTRVAWIAVLIFLSHPLQVESVAWISERKNLLSSFFILGSILFYLKHVTSQKSLGSFYWLSLFAFVLALLSKPIAVMLPCVFMLFDLCLLQRKPFSLEKIPFFLLALGAGLAVIFTHSAVGGITEYRGGNIVVSSLFTLRVYGDYLVSMLFPFGLSPLYRYLPSHLSDIQSYISWFVIPALFMFGITRIGSRPKLAFVIGWCVLWLLPVSNLIPINTLRQDRYLYLPLLAVFVALVSVVDQWAQNRGKDFWVNSGFAFGIVLLGFLTFQYSFTFASDHSYWQLIAKRFPQSSEAQFHAGYQCWLVKDKVCAEKRYRQALKHNPQHVASLNNLGALLIDRGDYTEARPLLERAQRHDPDYSPVYKNLAVVAAKTGVNKDRIPDWEKRYRALQRNKAKENLRLGAFRLK